MPDRDPIISSSDVLQSLLYVPTLANILIHLSWLSEQFQNSNQNVLKLVKHNTYCVWPACTKHKHFSRQLLIEIYGDKINLSSKVVVNVHIIVQ